MPNVLLIGPELDCGLWGDCIKEMEGFSVLTALDGFDAINWAKKQQSLDLAILLSLFYNTRMSSDLIIQELRNIHPAIKTIILSGYSGVPDPPVDSQKKYNDLIASIQKIGYDAYIRKPCHPEKFIDIITAVLNGEKFMKPLQLD